MRRYTCKGCGRQASEPARGGRPRQYCIVCRPPRPLRAPASTSSKRKLPPAPNALPVALATALHHAGRLGTYCSGVLVSEMTACALRAAVLWAEHGQELLAVGKQPFWVAEDRAAA